MLPSYNAFIELTQPYGKLQCIYIMPKLSYNQEELHMSKIYTSADQLIGKTPLLELSMKFCLIYLSYNQRIMLNR